MLVGCEVAAVACARASTAFPLRKMLVTTHTQKGTTHLGECSILLVHKLAASGRWWRSQLRRTAVNDRGSGLETTINRERSCLRECVPIREKKNRMRKCEREK